MKEKKILYFCSMKTSYDTYIFDLDGTLLDTLTDLTNATNHALRHFGMKERTLQEIRGFVGNGIRKLIERAVPVGTTPEQIEEVFGVFESYYLEHSLDATCPYDGVQELLRQLHEAGKHIAIVSNKIHAATQELCRRFFGNNADAVIGEQEYRGIKKKPAPDMVFEALKELKVSGERAVYVGDSEVDLATAHNAGLPCISVLWGFRDRDFLIKHGATTFVAAPEEITCL